MPPALPALPGSAYYIPDFISEADEALLLQHIFAAPAERWSLGRGRRTQNYGGVPGQCKITEELPPWLLQLVDGLVRGGAWPLAEDGVAHAPNHVIINDYSDGRLGLTPHSDGPMYAPRVAVLSLLWDGVLELHRPCDEAVRCETPTRLARMLLRRRSLNVLDADAYHLFHGIPEGEADAVSSETGSEHFVLNHSVAGLAPGSSEVQSIPRSRRVSIVFVCKPVGWAQRPS